MDKNKIINSCIKIQNLTKAYDNFFVLKGLNLTVPKTCFGLIGPNGSGKTTLILTILGLIKPDKGLIEIYNNGICSKTDSIRNRIGYLPEDLNFYPKFSGRENLKLWLELRKGLEINENELSETLKWSGIKEKFWDKRVNTYSKGMIQRLGLTQAFAGEPEIVILDEPFSNIDPLGRVEFIKKINNMKKKNLTIFITSHIISELEKLINWVAIINDGKIKVHEEINNLSQKYDFFEYEINLLEYKENIQEISNQLRNVLLNHKSFLLGEPTFLSEKIIFKTRKINKIKEILKKDHLNRVEIRPFFGTLEKIYEKVIVNS
jgi:ABC-type multidrug transport system ATPase subunit